MALARYWAPPHKAAALSRGSVGRQQQAQAGACCCCSAALKEARSAPDRWRGQPRRGRGMRRQRMRSTAWHKWPDAPPARSPPSGPAASRGAPGIATWVLCQAPCASGVYLSVALCSFVFQVHLRRTCSLLANGRSMRPSSPYKCKHGRPAAALLRTSRRRSSHLLLCAGLAGLMLATPALRIALCWVSAIIMRIKQTTIQALPDSIAPRQGRDRAVHLRGYAMATFFPGAGGKGSPASITSGWTAAGLLSQHSGAAATRQGVCTACAEESASQQVAYVCTSAYWCIL